MITRENKETSNRVSIIVSLIISRQPYYETRTNADLITRLAQLAISTPDDAPWNSPIIEPTPLKNKQTN